MTKKFKPAFTLAEVLITLAIVGVVAALTLPNLIANYQKKQTATQVKKVYTTLSQVIQRAIVDNGDVSLWDVPERVTIETSVDFAQKYFKPYLNVVKDCGIKTDGECKLTVNALNNQLPPSLGEPATKLFLNDGTELILRAPQIHGDRVLAFVYIDINGTSNPNRVGKDIFQFELHLVDPSFIQFESKLMPRFINKTRDELIQDVADRCHRNQNGNACTALLFIDNFEFKGDYPW